MHSLCILLMRFDRQLPDTRPLNQAIPSDQAAMQRRLGTHDRAALAARLDSHLRLLAGRIANDGRLWLPNNLQSRKFHLLPIIIMLPALSKMRASKGAEFTGQMAMIPQISHTLGNNLHVARPSALLGLLLK